MDAAQEKQHKVRRFPVSSKFNTLLIMVVLAVVLGTASGYFLSTKQSGLVSSSSSGSGAEAPKTAGQDDRLCRDFAEGTVKAKPQKEGDYSEGSHILERDSGYPVALTSSVVDLSEYEGKKVKIVGETQKALKEGWLMDVCRVETK